MSIETVALHCHHPLLTSTDLEGLVQQHGRRLRHFIRRRVSNADDVEDLIQDTYLEALRCLDRFQGASRPETWLFGIAVNLVRGHYKRNAQRPFLEDEVAEESRDLETAQDPLETIERQQALAHLERAAERLPSDTRRVLDLVLDQHLTYEQAASQLSIPVGTVRSRLSRARAALRSADRRRGGLL
ncbi:RNA polymerase sigma factor, sigma-70 family [Roseateles sp. YR242]|uniref:RNA polymerase sigma factor n=1 Tax=Roseateles sp. YR242 TaxID=1855305 RepID=UPI0008C96E03|nr:RNA polymerase sigma factor [Roseateles sp. YR242]SEK64122.1 RNA polymerase sigma factor, sigma-70 family [Roseateles sp. YR242]